MSVRFVTRAFLGCVICGSLAVVPARPDSSAYAQDTGSATQETAQQDADKGVSASRGADQEALEAEIDAVEKVLESGNLDDAEKVLSEYEADKPIPADAELSLPSDI